MRIAFCGKGGSGKTSLATLFIKYLQSKNLPVLAIDGDINQHLGVALGFSATAIRELPKLGQQQPVMKNYIIGTNPRIRQASDIIESTPAGRGSRLMQRDDGNPVETTFMLTQGSVKFMGIGGHEDHDVGATCFHKFTGAEGIFLNHYLDGADEFLIADMCAGADPFASSGLATRFDAIALVMEPTLKSVAVWHQAKAYADPHKIRVWAIANKISSPADLAFIEDQIGEKCLCQFAPLDVLRQAEKGQSFNVADLAPTTIAALQILEGKLLSLPPRDWLHYQQVGQHFHKRAAAGWASAMYGHDLTQQIDEEFRYPEPVTSTKQAA